MNKFKIKGKTYTILEELPIGDDTIFKGRWKVINSKKDLEIVLFSQQKADGAPT